jgi:AraC family transcriptional regulator
MKGSLATATQRRDLPRHQSVASGVSGAPPRGMLQRPNDRAGFRRHEIAGSAPHGTAMPAMAFDYRGGRDVEQWQKSWTGIWANLAEMRCDGHLDVELGSDSPRLSVVLEEVGGHLSIHMKGRDLQRPAAPQPLGLVPASIVAHGHATGISFIRHLVLQFDRSVLADLLGDEIDFAATFAPRPPFYDPSIMALARLIAAECASDEPHIQLYGDNLSTALMLALSRPSASTSRSIRSGQLPAWQVRRVTEYLYAHLAEDVRLQTVSELVNLSRSYFSRAFKSSTGLAPHQWLLEARIAKAKHLLLESDRTLSEIALDVGFADQSHFTRTFGRQVGQSPAAWRRAHCVGPRSYGLRTAR